MTRRRSTVLALLLTMSLGACSSDKNSEPQPASKSAACRAAEERYRVTQDPEFTLSSAAQEQARRVMERTCE